MMELWTDDRCRGVWPRFAGVRVGLAAGVMAAWCAAGAMGQAPATADKAAHSETNAPALNGSLQPLARAAAAQFQIAYRRDAAEHARRREQLAAAEAAWRAAGPSAANDKLMADWLRAAIRSSMPGSRAALPPVPEFGHAVAAPSRVVPRSASPARTALPTRSETTTQKPLPDGSHASGGAAHSSEPADKSLLPHDKAHEAGQEPTSSTTEPAAGAAETTFDEGFWTEHPANKDLPGDLSGGDPFTDDASSAAKAE